MLERVWRKGNPPTLLVGTSIGTATVENSMEVPQKTKNRINIWSSNPTPGHLFRQIITKKDTRSHMFIIILFTMAKTWKQPKCPSTDKWVKKMCFIYTMEYYSATKKNEIMSFTTTWIKLEIIILREVSQKQKDKYYMISLICGI